MSIAKKCDICGKLYESYNTKNDAKNTNGLRFLNIDKNMSYFEHDLIDCCPTCMDSLRKHIEYLKSLGNEKE